MPTIHFKTENRSVAVSEGDTILEGARKAGILLESPCNGNGTCGKCRVHVTAGNRGMLSTDSADNNESVPDILLACQARVFGDIEVTSLPREANETMKIVKTGKRTDTVIDPFITKRYDPHENSTAVYAGADLLGIEHSDTTRALYGAAIDIGTTTVVVALIDLQTGAEIETASALNPQAVYAQDVLSRIRFCQDAGGTERLHEALTQKLNELLGDIAGKHDIPLHHIYEAVYSGNTCMLHLAAGESPVSLGKYPYHPVLTGGQTIPASRAGLRISAFGNVYLPPVISSYVGADITSGILATKLVQRRGTTLFVDIGTNGEMVIARDGCLSATSTAAGPAFEGMNISHGMRAADGAIEFFEINGESVHFKTIGGGPSVGICGSGLLDIAGELAAAGVIGKNGRFASPDSLPDELARRLVKTQGGAAFIIEGDVAVTQKDIRQIQLAKGAVRSGIEYLLQSVGVTAGEVDSVMIAGSFGYHLRAESLLHIGLLPKAFAGKIQSVGNTSQTGGEAFLLNKSSRDELKSVVGSVQVLELANCSNFDRLFVQCLGF